MRCSSTEGTGLAHCQSARLGDYVISSPLGSGFMAHVLVRATEVEHRDMVQRANDDGSADDHK